MLADAHWGLPQAAGKRRVQVARHLHSQHLLLVLDNFEHLVGEADFVLVADGCAPTVSVLLTSRQPLGVTAEFVMPLAGLGVPDNDDWARRLARKACSCSWNAWNAPSTARPLPPTSPRIVNLCRFVEGSPLAIELLAPLVARDPSVTMDGVALTDFDLLSTPRADVPARSATCAPSSSRHGGCCWPMRNGCARAPS
ncbi:MAG: hypothetical protein R2838_15970 [Caldilineaceae bacterium]